MIDNGGLLESVIDHASQLDDVDYDDIAPTLAELTGSGDVSLVPRPREALDRFLDEENFYGRDLIAAVLAGVAGIAALPALLLAADRDLGDDQDGLQAEIAAVLDADPVAGRESILELIRSDAAERRRVGLLALGSVAEAGDVGLLEEAAGHPDPDVRLMAVEAVVDPAGARTSRGMRMHCSGVPGAAEFSLEFFSAQVIGDAPCRHVGLGAGG